MTKLKKILAAVLAASLLASFSVSISSFATEDYEPPRKFRRIDHFEIKVNNKDVAQFIGIEQIDTKDDVVVIYNVKDYGDSYSIISIDTDATAVYVPETLNNKKLVIDDFEGFFWSEDGWPMLFYVPKDLVEPFERIKERIPYNRDVNFNVFSHEDYATEHLTKIILFK